MKGRAVRRWVAAIGMIAACGGDSLEELAGIPGTPRFESELDGGGVRSGGGRRVDGGAGELRIAILAPAGMALLRATGAAPEVKARITSVRPDSDEPSADEVDAATLVWTLRGPAGAPITGRLIGPVTPGEYAGRLDLGTAITGDYVLSVSAATRAGTRATASVAVRLDAGPRIVVLSPTDGAPHRGSLVVRVNVGSAPFEPTMQPLEASVGPNAITLRPAGAPDLYEAVLEFDRFTPPLAGEQLLRIAARNAAGTRSEAQVRFVVDTDGPAFVQTEPPAGAVIGGVVSIRARLRDIAGVADGSVVAFIGNKTTVNFRVDLEPLGDGIFAALFDTRRLTACKRPPDPAPCIVWPNLSFRASDSLGNEATLGYDIAVDNQPPILDLDPPPMRAIKFDQRLRRNICSHDFDPVGDYLGIGDMPNDRCAVPQVFDLRALIEDTGNRADGLKDVPVAGLDRDSTTVFILDDTTQALVVDSDGDGICDELNPLLMPTTMPPTQSNQVLAIRLVPVTPRGGADYTPDPGLTGPGAQTDWPGCSSGEDRLAPLPLCSSLSQRMTIAIGWPFVEGPVPAIWSLAPVGEVGGAWCAGSQLDVLANEVANGWACIAAQARDMAGNIAVSAPLRVWIQRQGLRQTALGRCPAPPAEAGAVPDCTGIFNKQTRMRTAGVCRSPRYATSLRFDQPRVMPDVAGP